MAPRLDEIQFVAKQAAALERRSLALLAEFRLLLKELRGVAQPGSALALGARSRRFKSSRPDRQRFASL